jgi:hypothetical protein
MTPRVSVVIPSRNERFLAPTVRDLLAHGSDVEVLVILDGYWPPADQQLPSDPRLRILHRGAARGMRAAINDAVAISRGKFILKSDCLWPEGYDDVLVEDYHEDNWILVPRRYPLDPDNWAFEKRSDNKYPIDYHFLSEPFGKHGDSVPGLHGSEWRARRDARKDVLLDEEMASQGSAWFVSRKCWDWLGPQDESLYGKFWFENQEMSLKAWLRGGAQMVTKRTHYAHLYKGARHGRGYSTRDMGHEAATAFTSWFWMTDQPLAWRTRSMRWLLERFWPVPTWTTDLDAVFRRAHETFRNPYAAAAA